MYSYLVIMIYITPMTVMMNSIGNVTQNKKLMSGTITMRDSVMM